MELLGRHIILKLKSRFFDMIDAENELLQYENILEEMLLTIQVLVNAEEVTLYSCNEWKQQLYVEATTSSHLKTTWIPPAISSAELEKMALSQKFFRNPVPFSDFSHYDLFIPLKNQEKILGYLALKDGHDFFANFSNYILEELSEECGSFVFKAQQLVKIILEEKRHKQLLRVTEKFHSSMNMESVLKEIIFTLFEVYPTFSYYLLLTHDHKGYEDLPIKDLEYDSENIAAMQCYVTGTIQLEDSLAERKSVLYAPLKGKQGVYGVLQVIAPNTLAFPVNEIEFITLLANTAGSSIENAQLYEQSKRLVADLQLINEISHRLNSNLKLTETMAYMTDQIKKSFKAQEVGFILFSVDHNQIIVQDGSTDFFFTSAANQYIEYFKSRIILERDSIFIGDLTLPNVQRAAESYKSVMVVPMVQHDSLKGFCLVMHKEPYFFSFETFKLFLSLIHHSTLAFANTMLREELEKMVVTDHLTKLYSRNFLDDKVKQSLMEDEEGTFILIDIDNFKFVNDTYGHQVGDEVIIQVANAIRSNIRGTDIGARWGGEELAIYLPKISLAIGVQVAERLVKKVREVSKPSVTISCGVSFWNPEHKSGYNALFKNADRALYVAKRTGKNKVVVQDEQDTSTSLVTVTD